jgi:hypothetical protein
MKSPDKKQGLFLDEFAHSLPNKLAKFYRTLKKSPTHQGTDKWDGK